MTGLDIMTVTKSSGPSPTLQLQLLQMEQLTLPASEILSMLMEDFVLDLSTLGPLVTQLRSGLSGSQMLTLKHSARTPV